MKLEWARYITHRFMADRVVQHVADAINLQVLPLVRQYVPDGPTLATIVETNNLLVAGVSNWGGYAIATRGRLDGGIRCHV
jgi:hypothetical protein